MLKVEHLTVKIENKIVLRDVCLEIGEGETHVLLGPNGCGKTSLIKTILGFSPYKIVGGRILFEGRDITQLPIHERARLGMAVAFQNPPELRGVKFGKLLELVGGETQRLLAEVGLPLEFLERELNLGFSGGELKKSELLQVLAQKPKLALLDEPDSGVDVESLRVLGRVIDRLTGKCSCLIVTHLGYILRYVRAKVAHVMMDGEIVCSGDPERIVSTIMEKGYQWCRSCPKRRKS